MEGVPLYCEERWRQHGEGGFMSMMRAFRVWWSHERIEEVLTISELIFIFKNAEISDACPTRQQYQSIDSQYVSTLKVPVHHRF